MKKYFTFIAIFLFSVPLFASSLEEVHQEVIKSIENKNKFNNSFLVEKFPGFYEINRQTEQSEIEKIKSSLKLGNDEYGFDLDILTQKICGNKVKDHIVQFNREEDSIFFYLASCKDWCGEGICGKGHYAVLRRSKGMYINLWSHVNSGSYQPFIELNWYSGYVSDLDHDGNIEILIEKSSGVRGRRDVFELTPKGAELIASYDQSTEGQ